MALVPCKQQLEALCSSFVSQQISKKSASFVQYYCADLQRGQQLDHLAIILLSLYGALVLPGELACMRTLVQCF